MTRMTLREIAPAAARSRPARAMTGSAMKGGNGVGPFSLRIKLLKLSHREPPAKSSSLSASCAKR